MIKATKQNRMLLSLQGFLLCKVPNKSVVICRKVPHKSVVLCRKVPHKSVVLCRKVPHKSVVRFAILFIFSIFAAKYIVYGKIRYARPYCLEK